MRSRRALVVLGLAIAALVVPSASLGVGDMHQHTEKPDVDTRSGTASPTAAQRSAVQQLGAAVTWNRFGAPGTLTKYGGFLAEGISAPSAADAARSWLEANKALYRLSSLDGLELATEFRMPDSDGWMVHFRQTFGGVPAGAGDGLITVGVVGTPASGWKVAHVSSTASGNTGLAAQPTLTGEQAWVLAAKSLGESFSVANLANPRLEGGWLKFDVPGIADVQQVRPVAVPAVTGGARPAFEAIFFHATGSAIPKAYAVFVDAATGKVLVRHSMVDYAAPKWQVFPAYPTPPALAAYPWNVASTDIRQTWCWTAAAGCARLVETAGSPYPWDVVPKAAESSSLSTNGNNAVTIEAWGQSGNPVGTGHTPTNADRNYSFAWTNVWSTTECSPTNFTPHTGLDISAAVLNLFVGHNRMHDFTYALGFQEKTWNAQLSNFESGGAERDPVRGHAQAGGAANTRDNANMTTNADGSMSVTNMFLWQPARGAFYAPCVDGDYDMAVIGHEYGHMVENRMIGKGSRRSGHHAGAMGESNGDLMAMELLNASGSVPVADENPYAVGAYATGNKVRGIRNFAMDQSPLNFSNMGYDLTGPQVHADGEIWSATNFEIRKLMVAKYNSAFPYANRALQEQCLAGVKPASECPGNRRWVQLMFDAYLLMPTNPTMLQARDAYLAADMMRFGGANQSTLWTGFARRGMGEGAFATNGTSNSDTDPKPDFTSPVHDEGTLRFQAIDPVTKAQVTNARIIVGEFEPRTSPVADTDPATDATGAGANTLDDVAGFLPGKYKFIVTAPGYGHTKFTWEVKAGLSQTVQITLPENYASKSRGATATGDGARLTDLIDDNEATNWEWAGTTSAAGKSVTIDLGGKKPIKYVQASAFLIPGNNRFTALRSFEVWACNATVGGTDCSNPASFTKAFASPSDAFPSDAPRPTGPSLAMRRWALPGTVYATHVRFVAVANQCIGQPQFQGVQDDDPASTTDCRTNGAEAAAPNAPAAQDTSVRASELQLQGRNASVRALPAS